MTRRCGDCQLCCRVIAVESLGKGQYSRCQHQRHRKGCALFGKFERPLECEIWVCGWLSEYDTADMPRPDRCHYVIDCAWPPITLDTAERGRITVKAIPIWTDPKYPDAYKAPELKAYLLRRAAEGKLGLINNRFLLVPPAMSATGEWQEMTVGGAKI